MEEHHIPEVSTGVVARRRKWWIWLLAVVAVLVIAAGAVTYWGYREYQPPAPSANKVSFTVAQGESVTGIADALAAHGLIRNAFVFHMYVSWHHVGSTFKAGQYEIAPGTSIPGIIVQLTEGQVVDPTLSVTIPEGFTIQQIAERLEDKHICTAAAFIDSVQHDSFAEPFLQSLPHNSKIKYRLEGYLFPDTYRFKPGTSAHQVADAMLKDFQTRIEGVIPQIQANGQSLPVVITEASMIEREAKVASERTTIASVIVNRLRIHMRLQMDCTLQYILGHQEIVTDKDTKVVDPYNTYLNPGLPPGPIANPGMASIQAAISPAKTDYLYYVVKNDGTGSDYFAKTYQEQLHNEYLSQQNLKNHSKG